MKYAFTVLTILALSGCASEMLSDQRIADNTALAIGRPRGTVAISDRQTDGLTNTYYTARSGGVTYRCSINGGGLLAAGMTNPPQCSRS